MISATALAVLVKTSLAITAAAPFVLLFILYQDKKNKSLW